MQAGATRMSMPLKPAARASKFLADPATARGGAWLFFVFSAAEFFLGFKALASGCIRTMRGRHGPGVLHCTPDPWYWGHTAIAFLLGAGLAVVGCKLLQLARRARTDSAAGR